MWSLNPLQKLTLSSFFFRIHEKACSEHQQPSTEKRYVITNPPPDFNLFSSDRVGLQRLEYFWRFNYMISGVCADAV